MRPKVLIIENDQRDAQSLANSLGSAAVEIADESAAIDQLNEEHYDLVLCDLAGRRPRTERFMDAIERVSSVEGTVLAIISDDPVRSEALSDAGITVLGPNLRPDDLRALVDFASTPRV
jgi:BarA-like signal transduction histidine kinase